MARLRLDLVRVRTRHRLHQGQALSWLRCPLDVPRTAVRQLEARVRLAVLAIPEGEGTAAVSRAPEAHAGLGDEAQQGVRTFVHDVRDCADHRLCLGRVAPTHAVSIGEGPAILFVAAALELECVVVLLAAPVHVLLGVASLPVASFIPQVLRTVLRETLYGEQIFFAICCRGLSLASAPPRAHQEQCARCCHQHQRRSDLQQPLPPLSCNLPRLWNGLVGGHPSLDAVQGAAGGGA
mmetsp:Transcript_20740/g.64800  ORF Transcript_20740/g.64800 Transcript_20740/m.64800 type:complete len:237 (+) Transcript_20740:1271-1981(+)